MSRKKGNDEPEDEPQKPDNSESEEIAEIKEIVQGQTLHDVRVNFVLSVVEQQISLAHDRSLHENISLEQQQAAGELIVKLARLFNFYMYE